jgi:hypothetical protein
MDAIDPANGLKYGLFLELIARPRGRNGLDVAPFWLSPSFDFRISPDVAVRLHFPEITSYFVDDGISSITIALRVGVGRVSNGPMC